MRCWKGRMLSAGTAAGEIFVYDKCLADNAAKAAGTPAQEEVRYDEARAQAKREQARFGARMKEQGDEDAAAIFEIHEMLLEDEDYDAAVRAGIRENGKTAAAAVRAAGEYFRRQFEAMEDEYFRARAADFTDIAGCLENLLCGRGDPLAQIDRPVILAADELTPSETVRLPRRYVLAFATRTGSQTSHTAILARSMGVPAIAGVPVDSSWDGAFAIVDGASSSLILEPEEEALARARAQMEQQKQKAGQLRAQRGLRTQTKEGRRLRLYANIGCLEDMAEALAEDAEGIGLFRTEFLFLGRAQPPDEEEQFRAYKAAVTRMGGKPVVIRTLDVGADKQAACLALPREENPAMGCRAIRLCLQRPQLFKTQLRAILRAGAFGPVCLMFPLIVSEGEVLRALEYLEEARRELKAQGTAFALEQTGIMVETPAAAVMSDVLARRVDFFSIGTNDLTQYTLAADRQNACVDAMMDPHDPAVLRLIEKTVENGHAGGCWVGICGELGADPALTRTFVEMGVDELSVAPQHILALRAAIREL